MKKAILPILLICFALLAISCSASSNSSPTSANLPDVANELNSSRSNLGFYTVDINPETLTASITPNRALNAHMNVKEYLLGWPCGNCLQIKNLQFLPGNQVECDIEVTHPVPYSVFTVFDLRVIAMFPADEFFYGMGASTALLNSDGLTALWDNPAIPGYLNGYKAYNKGEARRPFGPGDVFSEHFLIQLPAGFFSYDIGVDASWAPNDGITFPIEMNSFEVIDLDGQVSAGLTDQGGSAELEISMYDYQGTGTISAVKAYCEDLFNAPVSLSYVSGDGYNATYGATVSNEKHAPAGTYSILIESVDSENVNYPYMVASYRILDASVVPELVDVEITLLENDIAKTPGNTYDYYSYSGAVETSVIDYFDSSGPWDFTTVTYTGSGTQSTLSTDDPEVAGFTDDFPDADHFNKAGGAYQAESHDYARSKVIQHGFYESETAGGSVVFQGTIDGFHYPYNTSTNYEASFSCTLLSLPTQITYDTDALGVGLCTVPYDGGTTKSALILRTVVETESLFIVVLKALIYEWYDDDGNLIAGMLAVNVMGEEPNWNESTYEITGTGNITALYDMYRQ